MASDSSNDNSFALLQLKQFWQIYNFTVEDANVSTREKLDALRTLFFFLQKLLSSKEINETSYEELKKNLTLQYHNLSNNNNEMFVLTEGKRNESQSWVSGLSWDNSTNLHSIKDLIQQKKKKTENMKICFSKRKFHQKVSALPGNNDSMPNQQRNERVSRNEVISSSQNIQQPLQESSKTPITNEFHVPRFGKRKTIHLEQETTNKIQKKKQVKNIHGQENISCMNGRIKSITYGHENRGIDNNPAEEVPEETRNPFLTAKEQLRVEMKKSGKMPTSSNSHSSMNYGQAKKSLGGRGISGKFVPPIGQENSDKKQAYGEKKGGSRLDTKYEEFEWMKNIDSKMVELIENEIMDHGAQVSWNDIAGLEFAKTTIQEIVIWPMLRPDLFTGLRGPPKGLLLFGPPGTGKTLIGKCIASQSNAKFFNISASSLTSKWIGDGEKMVRALFGVARCHQPAVIFIDEIDSLLTQRSESEHESSRRIKTEFLVQLDGATASSKDQLLVVGATNRPQELDEAARRRLVKRLYIPLPDGNARRHIVNNLMSTQPNDLLDKGIDDIISKTDGFSGADMASLCREAALGPIRNVGDIRLINADEVRPVNLSDFLAALKYVRPSVSQNDLQSYIDWNITYGSGCGL